MQRYQRSSSCCSKGYSLPLGSHARRPLRWDGTCWTADAHNIASRRSCPLRMKTSADTAPEEDLSTVTQGCTSTCSPLRWHGDDMLFCSSSSQRMSEVLGDAIAAALRDASKQLPEDSVPSFCFLFVSSSYCNLGEAGGVLVTEDTRVFQQGSEKYSRAMSLISRNFLQRGWKEVPIAGCSVGGSILGDSENVGKNSGVSVVLASLPDSQVSPFFVKPEVLRRVCVEARLTHLGQVFNDGWRQVIVSSRTACPGIEASSQSDWEKIGVPSSFQPGQEASGEDAVLDSLDFVFPSARKATRSIPLVGALAGRTVDTHEREFFFLPSLKVPLSLAVLSSGRAEKRQDMKDIASMEQCCFSEGLAGIAFRGGHYMDQNQDSAAHLYLCAGIAADAVVAQGSRPIGPNYEVREMGEGGAAWLTWSLSCGRSARQKRRRVLLWSCSNSLSSLAPSTSRVSSNPRGSLLTGRAQLLTCPLVPGTWHIIDSFRSSVSSIPSHVEKFAEDEQDKHQYIVRPILNVEKEGPVYLADGVRVGQVVRFHIRDAANAGRAAECTFSSHNRSDRARASTVEDEMETRSNIFLLILLLPPFHPPIYLSPLSLPSFFPLFLRSLPAADICCFRQRNSRKVDKKLPAGALLFADQVLIVAARDKTTLLKNMLFQARGPQLYGRGNVENAG
eukprot:754989-Hanusia_phi.AAC.2